MEGVFVEFDEVRLIVSSLHARNNKVIINLIMLGAPTAEMLQDMIDKDHDLNYNRYKKAQTTYYKSGAFPQDIMQKAQKDLVKELSNPLKKMRSAFLLDVAKTCYPDKWLSPEMPNEP